METRWIGRWVAGALLVVLVLLGGSLPASAMVTTDLFFNVDFADLSSSNVIVSSQFDALPFVQITYYVSRAGEIVAVNTEAPLVAVPAFTTVKIPLKLKGFAGSQILVRVQSVDGTGSPSSSSFVALLQTDTDASPVSGQSFVGNTFYLPVLGHPKQHVRLLISVIVPTVVPAVVNVRFFGTPLNEDLQVVGFGTVAWDSTKGHGHTDPSLGGYLQISSSESLVVSAFVENNGHDALSSHIYLPVAFGLPSSPGQ